MSTDGSPPDLSRLAAEHLATLLESVPGGGPLRIEPSAALCDALEYLVPSVLRRRHPEWRGESLDGFRFSSAVKTGVSSAELTGLCILISDQSVTPCRLSMRLSDSGGLARLGIRLGEPGGGPLGISGPAVDSSAASRLLRKLDGRAETLDWVYEAERVGPMTDTLDEVLELAASDAWDDRERAAEELARFTGARADAVLARLLNDARNTAVTTAAARTLLARDDAASAEVLLRFLGVGDDEAVDHALDEFPSAWHRGVCPGLRARTVAAFTADDPLLVAGARELLDEMGWWDGPPPHPATIDGWNVRLTADVREPVATCDGLHYVRDGYVSGVAYLVVASHPQEPGVALLWCDHHWNAVVTTRHFDDDLALAQAAFHFGPMPYRDGDGRIRVLPAFRPRGLRGWLRWRG